MSYQSRQIHGVDPSDPDVNNTVKVTADGGLVVGSASGAEPLGVSGITDLTGLAATTITATTAATAAITAEKIHVSSDTLCFIAIAAAPTAAIGTGYPIHPGATYELSITSGHKVAVIGTSGTLWIHPVA